MRIKCTLLLIFTLLFSTLPEVATAQPVNECRIKPSSQQNVSLGFPVNPERLSRITDPKILVIPYRLKGETGFQFGNIEKEYFTKVSDNVYKISGGRSRVIFSYNNIINLEMTVDERDAIRQPQNNNKTEQERYNDSTWGFMKKFITDQDSKIDYSGFDAVILYSRSAVVAGENAEAMMMTKDLYGAWFNPIETNEGPISNVVVLYNRFDDYTFTHEVMHLFGLTDLYGSINSPQNSLMSDSVMGLLAWEKWTLGWIGDENVQCISAKEFSDFQTAKNTYVLDYGSSDQLLVLPTGAKTALVVDVTSHDNKSFLGLHSLNNDSRPPISAYKSSNSKLATEITKHLGVGVSIQSPQFTLLISDNDGQKLTVELIPIKLFFSESAKQLQTLAESNRLKYLKIEEQAAVLANKKITITCVKGKLTKKVIAVKPVCPKGYKKK